MRDVSESAAAAVPATQSPRDCCPDDVVVALDRDGNAFRVCGQELSEGEAPFLSCYDAVGRPLLRRNGARVEVAREAIANQEANQLRQKLRLAWGLIQELQPVVLGESDDAHRLRMISQTIRQAIDLP